MSDLYRLTKTQMVEGSMHAMNGGTYMGHLVPATIDYEAAVTVLSNYRRLVLMGVEDPFVATLDELFDAAVGEDKT